MHVDNIIKLMNRKFSQQNYEVLVTFKSNQLLAISAQFKLTGQFFMNEAIQLIRINKETVIAALQRRSEKQLRCEFEQQVQEGKKELIITFIISYDFLPEFRQQIRLEQAQAQQSLVSIQSEVSEINRALQTLGQTGNLLTLAQASITFSSVEVKQVWSQDVAAGKYMVRISGMINNPVGYQPNQSINIIICPSAGQSKIQSIKTYHNSGYHYPFFTSEVIDCGKGQLKVKMQKCPLNSVAMNLNILLSPINRFA